MVLSRIRKDSIRRSEIGYAKIRSRCVMPVSKYIRHIPLELTPYDGREYDLLYETETHFIGTECGRTIVHALRKQDYEVHDGLAHNISRYF
jgi:hypothetical protein